jgi:DNA processing protein
MLELRDAVALSLLPGAARFDAVSRIDRSELGHLLESAGAPRDGTPGVALDELCAASGLTPPSRSLLDEAARAIERGHGNGLRAVPWFDPRYPERLRAIADPPAVIWVRGRVRALADPAVAIVGARAASPGARHVAADLGGDLAAAGLVVVSGMARGVDGAAHLGALATGRTVAVLGCGADVVYPGEHATLATRIVERGAIVSEFPPGTSPQPHHFPLRNRLISGLSLGVVVVEASEDSGSLITARCALDQGRDVMAVPGPVTGGRNRGAHALLRDGARLVESAADVLDELGLGPAAASRVRPAGPGDAVLAALQPGEPVDLDEVASRTGLPAARVLSRLARLEVDGHVARVPGGLFVRDRR